MDSEADEHAGSNPTPNLAQSIQDQEMVQLKSGQLSVGLQKHDLPKNLPQMKPYAEELQSFGDCDFQSIGSSSEQGSSDA